MPRHGSTCLHTFCVLPSSTMINSTTTIPRNNGSMMYAVIVITYRLGNESRGFHAISNLRFLQMTHFTKTSQKIKNVLLPL